MSAADVAPSADLQSLVDDVKAKSLALGSARLNSDSVATTYATALAAQAQAKTAEQAAHDALDTSIDALIAAATALK